MFELIVVNVFFSSLDSSQIHDKNSSRIIHDAKIQTIVNSNNVI